MKHSLFSADDHSRVVLTQLDRNPCSDYVNASYIDVSCSISPCCGMFRNLHLLCYC